MAFRNKTHLRTRLLNFDFKQATNLRKDTSFQWFFNKKARTGGVFDPQTGIGTLCVKKVKNIKATQQHWQSRQRANIGLSYT